MARKIASVKKAIPSNEKGIPITGPANSIKVGHKSPSSKETTVPETAPMANIIATPCDQCFAILRYTSSLDLSHFNSEITINSGSPTPTAPNMMWNIRVMAI